MQVNVIKENFPMLGGNRKPNNIQNMLFVIKDIRTGQIVNEKRKPMVEYISTVNKMNNESGYIRYRLVNV